MVDRDTWYRPNSKSTCKYLSTRSKIYSLAGLGHMGCMQATLQSMPGHYVKHPACQALGSDHCTVMPKLKSVSCPCVRKIAAHSSKWQQVGQRKRHMRSAASEDEAQLSGIEVFTSDVTERETNAQVRAKAQPSCYPRERSTLLPLQAPAEEQDWEVARGQSFRSLPIMPLSKVKLPQETISLQLFEPRYRLLFKLVKQSSSRRFGLVLADRQQGMMESIGCLCELTHYIPVPERCAQVNGHKQS